MRNSAFVQIKFDRLNLERLRHSSPLASRKMTPEDRLWVKQRSSHESKQTVIIKGATLTLPWKTTEQDRFCYLFGVAGQSTFDSNPKLSLGSAYVKYGVWPGPNRCVRPGTEVHSDHRVAYRRLLCLPNVGAYQFVVHAHNVIPAPAFTHRKWNLHGVASKLPEKQRKGYEEKIFNPFGWADVTTIWRVGNQRDKIRSYMAILPL